MPNFLIYAIALTLNAAIIGCVTHFYWSIFQRHSTPFPIIDGHRSIGARKYALYAALVAIGTGVATFAFFHFMFSWMPDEWSNNDEQMTLPQLLATAGTILTTPFLLLSAGTLSEKIEQLKDGDIKSAEFDEILENLLRLLPRKNDQYTASDLFDKTKKIVVEALSAQRINFRQAETINSVIDRFRVLLTENRNSAPSGDIVEIQKRKQAEFKICTSDYWVKTVGMLQNNWALIEPEDGNNVMVYFVTDTGTVFDEMTFSTVDEATSALRKNKFERYADNKSLMEITCAPRQPWKRGTHPNGNIYSSGKFWSN